MAEVVVARGDVVDQRQEDTALADVDVTAGERKSVDGPQDVAAPPAFVVARDGAVEEGLALEWPGLVATQTGLLRAF